MRNIAVIGVGYVGLVTGACFADLGNKVRALDISEERIANLNKGILPIYEPGLGEVVDRNYHSGRLSFTTSYAEALKEAEFVFICVGTPQGVDGEADLQYVRQAAETIAKTMDHRLIIINKSTVPVGTGDWVSDIVRDNQPKPIPFSVVSCPEFLREGSALIDFMNPDRTVLGSLDRAAASEVATLHHPLRAPIVITDLRTAEMIKYASNAFLATKISFINEIANICEALGADVKEVAAGMGLDKRIGRFFLDAGIGYGGSCFSPDETLFTADGSKLTATSFESLFASSGKPFKGDSVEVITPTNTRVLALDLQTGCPEIAEVKALTRRVYQGAMVTLKTSMGRSIKVTADHPVIVHTNNALEIVLAMHVKAGDQLIALTQLPITLKAPASMNLIELLCGTELANDVYVSPIDQSFTDQYDQFKQHIPADVLAYPHEIKRYNRMSLNLYYRLVDGGVLSVPAEKLQLYTAKGAAAKINAIIPVDADLMRLMGFYLAEGYIGTDTGRAGAQRERIGFCFHEDETEYIADTQRILNRYGLKFIERNATSATTTLVSSRIFAWFIREVLGCGTRSENKALPAMAFSVSPELRHELIRGAISGDGAFSPVQNGKNAMIEYATVSKRLADGMALLLQSVGIIPSIRVRRMNKSKRPAYILRINGYNQLKALTNVFGEKRHQQMETLLDGYQRQIAQRGFTRHGVFAALTVQSALHEVEETQVYSLETELGTVVVGSGLAMHNCFPKDVSALKHMATVQGKHPQLLQAVMDINYFQRRVIVNKLRETLGDDLKGKVIGLLGLAFKPNTDDMREAPAITIAELLQEAGAIVKGYDPVSMEHAERMIPNIDLCGDAYETAAGCDAVVVVTEWNEFKNLDLEQLKSVMRHPVIIDGRNIYDPDKVKNMGFQYRGFGRGYNGKHEAAESIARDLKA